MTSVPEPVAPTVPRARVDRYRDAFFTSDSTERTVFFSDAVFAIAMTLLVLEIKIPGSDELKPDELLPELGHVWFEFFGYALSFFFIANTWLFHHHIWKLITKVTVPAQWLNLMLLFFVAFTPVPTALIADYGPTTPTAPVFYALSIAAVGVSLLLLLIYCRRAGLLSDEVEPDMYLMIRRQQMVSPAVFLFSAAVALGWKPVFGTDVGPLIAMFSWSLMWPVFFVSNLQIRRRLRAHDRREAAARAGLAES